MKYLVITSKHHDGFCLWDSEYTDYDMMSTPFQRDLLRELSDECQRQGLLFGTYYSICDWSHPHYTTRYGGDSRPLENSNLKIYVAYLKNQVKELIKKYDTSILWFDGEWEKSWNHQLGMELYQYVRDLKDDILINNRVDKGRTGMKGMTVSSQFAGDFGTPEQEVGAFLPEVPWESCLTICQQWAWKPDDKLKSRRECIQTLARTAGGGGNLLLNVGPMPDGRIEPRQVERLREIGLWLEKYGESIYETRGGPLTPTEQLVSTHKDNKIYLHLLARPSTLLTVPALENYAIKSVRLLNGEPLIFSQNNYNISIQLIDQPIDEDDTVIVIEFD